MLDLPMNGTPNQADPYEEAGYVYASTFHWQPLMNGYTGNPPLAFGDTLRLTRQLPDPEAVHALARLGLRYIVVHMEHMPAEGSARWREISADNRLREIARFADSTFIYEAAPTARTLQNDPR